MRGSARVLDYLDRYQGDRSLVSRAVDLLRDTVTCCEAEGDFVSRALLREALDDEEQHLHWLDVRQRLIARIGLQRFTQSRSED